MFIILEILLVFFFHGKIIVMTESRLDEKESIL